MIYLDFEFFNPTEPDVTLVCCHTFNSETNESRDWWLLNDVDVQAELATYLWHKRNEILVGYAMVAEFRSIISLGLDPSKFESIDLFIEYRAISNQNDKWMYGKQLVNGVVRETVKPPSKWNRDETDGPGFKQSHSLVEATYKLTGKIRDNKHKDKMRDIIISGNVDLIEENKSEIMAYCREDVLFLPEIYEAIIDAFYDEGVTLDSTFPGFGDYDRMTLHDEMLLRGRYSALVAKMESLGYPIDIEATKNFSSSVGPVLESCQREINSFFPDIRPFKYSRKDKKFTWDQKATKLWLRDNVNTYTWMKTDGFEKAFNEFKNDYIAARPEQTEFNDDEIMDVFPRHEYCSLSLEAFQRVIDFKHEYPSDNFLAQMIRYLKLKQHMNGFVPSKKKKTFWDAVGSDGRVRPYINHYRALTGRNQAGSTALLFLKPAWVRTLCQPKPGKAICGFDYSSQEFLISGIVSKDQNMIDAYASGDVYLYYAKLGGTVPWDGTKEEYKEERDRQKPIILGLSFSMSKYGLATQLTEAYKRTVSEDEAQEIIDDFYERFKNLKRFQNKLKWDYLNKKIDCIRLVCGWRVWLDSDNWRSFLNSPIQGHGSSVLRRAQDLCDRAGLNIIFPLHDCLYMEYDSGDYAAIDKFHDCMRQAFIDVFPDNVEAASLIRLEGYAWSPDYPAIKEFTDDRGRYQLEFESVKTPGGIEIDIGNKYLDERALDEYYKFNKYFKKREESSL